MVFKCGVLVKLLKFLFQEHFPYIFLLQFLSKTK